MEIKEYSPTEAGLSDIKSRMEGVTYDVTNVLGMAQAKRDRKELVTLRTSLESMRKELKKPALERSRLIDAEATRIKGQIIILEEPIDKQIKVEEKRLSDIKEEKRLEAQKRDFGIMESITKIKTMIDRVGTFHAAKFDECLAFIEAMDLTEEKFLTFLPLAIEARDQALKDITAIRDAKVEAEAEAERVEKERLAKLETERIEREAEDERLKEEKETLRIEREAFDKQKDETDRISGIKEKILEYYGPSNLVNIHDLSTHEITGFIKHLETQCTEEVFAEFTREADCKREDLLRSLTDILAAAEERERVAAQLKKDQEKQIEDKRIADEKETKRLQDVAAEEEKKRLAAEKEKRKLARQKKLADNKCDTSRIAFNRIISVIATPDMTPDEKLDAIGILAEANA